jgi:hypothetical protein
LCAGGATFTVSVVFSSRSSSSLGVFWVIWDNYIVLEL